MCWDEESARLSRAHNDANMLSLGQRLVPEAILLRIVDVWLRDTLRGRQARPGGSGSSTREGDDGHPRGAEPGMRIYTHYRHRRIVVPFVLMGALGVLFLGGLFWSATTPAHPGPPVPVFLAGLLVVAINFWVLAGTAMEVRLESEGMVEFVAPFRTTRIPAADIESIRPSDAMRGAFFVLRHRNGGLRFDPKLDGMHELIAELKRHNPAIELRGI